LRKGILIGRHVKHPFGFRRRAVVFAKSQFLDVGLGVRMRVGRPVRRRRRNRRGLLRPVGGLIWPPLLLLQTLGLGEGVVGKRALRTGWGDRHRSRRGRVADIHIHRISIVSSDFTHVIADGKVESLVRREDLFGGRKRSGTLLVRSQWRRERFRAGESGPSIKIVGANRDSFGLGLGWRI
jgi:hypothetical protein